MTDPEAFWDLVAREASPAVPGHATPAYSSIVSLTCSCAPTGSPARQPLRNRQGVSRFRPGSMVLEQGDVAR